MVAEAPIAWPDAMPTATLEQPIRARIVAVAPGDTASPFEDRGKPVPWFEVRTDRSLQIAKRADGVFGFRV